MPERLYLGGSAYPVQGLGPGRRAVVWVSGCAKQCRGCMAPELWPRSAPMPVAAVAEEVLPGLAGADGLTLSGGEPFDQPQALARLIALLRERYVELEVLAYSGYLLEELQQAGSAVAELLRAIDMLIDGAYREEMPCTLIWRGSDNQRLHLLSPRAQRHAWAVAAPWPEPRPLQVRALGGTRWLIAGIPHRGGLEIMRAGLRARGFGVIPKAAEPGG